MRVDRQPFDPGPAAWNELLGPGPEYPELVTNELADVLIIGAGFAGLSAARRLQQLQPESKIILLEARRVGDGPAGRNSGFMIDLPHNLSSKDYAGDAAIDAQQTRLNREAIAFAKEAAAEFGMSKHALAQNGKVNAAATKKGVQHNHDYALHLKSMNEQHELLDAHSMRQISGSSYYKNGLFTPGTVMLQPALYVRELAKGLSSNGLSIFENSPAMSFEQVGSDWSVSTPKGRVTAGKCILAVNGHLESFGFFKRQLMHIYLYASMTRALSPDESKLLGGEDNWAFTPADPMGTTVRKISGSSGNRILVRNRFAWSPNRTVSENKIHSIAPTHDRSFKARFPQLAGTNMEYRWGGLLCLSLNTVPAFGEIKPNLFSACCQNGLGTAMGTLSGKLAAEQAFGHSSNSLEIMSNSAAPKRLPPEPFASLGANAYMRWAEFKAGAEL